MSTNLLDGAYFVAAEGNLVAVGAFRGVTLFSVSTPSAGVLKHEWPVQNSIGSLAISKSVLAMASPFDQSVTLLSVSNLDMPVELATLEKGSPGWDNLGAPSAVAISGNLLVIASRDDHVVTLANITDPSHPLPLAALKQGSFGFADLIYPNSVAVAGNLLAIANWDTDGPHQLVLVDVSDPVNPAKRATLDIDAIQIAPGQSSLALAGNALALATASPDVVILIDVTDPDKPALRASLQGGERVALSPTRLAIASLGSVTLFDVSNLGRPLELGAATDGVAGMHLLPLRGMAFAGTNIALAQSNFQPDLYPSYSGFSLLSFQPQPLGLLSRGWVGVGTSSPTAPLDVVGSVAVEQADFFSVNAERVELGVNNTASAGASTAIGERTIASAVAATALGDTTIASGFAATALGSKSNASGDDSIAGGDNSTASGVVSFAMGEHANASGRYSTALGSLTTAGGEASFAAGSHVRALTDHSFVWGDGQTGSYFDSTRPDQFLIRAQGGVVINTAFPAAALDVTATLGGAILGTASTGNALFGICYDSGSSGVYGENQSEGFGLAGRTSGEGIAVFGENTNDVGWAGYFHGGVGVTGQLQLGTAKLPGSLNYGSYGLIVEGGGINVKFGNIDLDAGDVTAQLFLLNSDRNAKADFAPADTGDVLDRLIQIPIQTWRFKTESKGIKHLGPMAQDFHHAYGLGSTPTAIASVDESGVALAAIQGLNEKVEKEVRALRTELASKEASIKDLNSQITELRRLVDDLSIARKQVKYTAVSPTGPAER